ncbi:MAG: trypsin-like serine protease [Deltaproteobacteria bacterium]|nr:trypsin-like serine protease [Deltaproteobacteria bacterium]
MLYVNGKVCLGVIITIILLAGCGSYEDSDKAGLREPSGIASSAVDNSQYPAVVKVILPEGRGLCSGTFISPRAVLTAGHCATEDGRYTIRASFGTFSTSQKVSLVASMEVDNPNDLSILILDQDVASEQAGQIMRIADGVGAGDEVRLVGFGCNNLETRTGSGVKRTGTNQVWRVSEYIDLLTPQSDQRSSRAIIGAENRAGSCFGDSGGPMFTANGLVGVAHAGGKYGSDYLSEYTNVGREDNRQYLVNANNTYNLRIPGL